MKKLSVVQVSQNDQFLQDQNSNTNQGFSLAEYSQTHPFQYLKHLNNVYQTCNKSSEKCYSSASMVKLPWKKFKPVSIPKCFQDSYNLERKEYCVQKNSDQNEKSQQQEKQRKFWKQHEQLMRKYYRNNITNNNFKKKKMEERRRNLLSAKSYTTSHAKNKSSFSNVQNDIDQRNCDKQNYHNQNNQQKCGATKTESGQTQMAELKQSRKSILKKNDLLADRNSLKDKSNIYLKKIMQKGTNLNYDEIKLEEQVLQKLKKISQMPHYNRAKTANILSRQGPRNKDRQRQQKLDKICVQSSNIKQSRVKQGQYLQFSKEQQLINRYKNKIKMIDCSISQKNVKKTAQILKQMQQLVNVDIDDY